LELVVKKFGYYMDKKQLAISVIKHNNIPLLDRLLKIYPEILNYTSLDEIKRTKEEENIGVKIVNINYSYMYAAITTNNPRIVQMVQERINTKNQELAPNLFKEKTKSLGIAAARMTRVTSLIIKDDDPDIMFYALEGGNKELLGDRKFQVTYKHILQAIKGDNDEIVTDVLSRAGDVKVNPMVILQNVMTKSLSVIRVVVLWLRQKYDLTIDQIHYINTYCVNGFPYSDYDKEKIDIVLNNTTHDGSNSDITNLLSNLARNKENSPDILEFISERFNVSETDWRQVNDAAESVLNYKISWYLADKI
jgi:hypothetical protein